MEPALLLTTGFVSLIYLFRNINFMVFGGVFDFALILAIFASIVLIDFSVRKTKKATTRPAVLLVTSGLILLISTAQLLFSSHPIHYFFTTDFQWFRVLSMSLLTITMFVSMYQLATAPAS